MWLLAVSLFSLSLPGSGRSEKLPGVVTVINEQFFEAGAYLLLTTSLLSR